MDVLMNVTDSIKSFKSAKLSGLRPAGEFFDYQRISRPADLNQATTRITYNMRYFSGNYGVIVALLSVYAILTNYLLLISLAFLIFGFIAINKYAPEATQFGDHTVTQKHLYIGLFVIGFPMLWIAAPFSTLFWLIGASGMLVFSHAAMLELGVESDYTVIQENV